MLISSIGARMNFMIFEQLKMLFYKEKCLINKGKDFYRIQEVNNKIYLIFKQEQKVLILSLKIRMMKLLYQQG